MISGFFQVEVHVENWVPHFLMVQESLGSSLNYCYCVSIKKKGRKENVKGNACSETKNITSGVVKS